MDQQLGGTQFPLAYCAVCDREVLTHLGLEDDDPRCCVHCDTPVSEALLRTTTLSELELSGYAEVPASSCGSGGCGSGGCRR